MGRHLYGFGIVVVFFTLGAASLAFVGQQTRQGEGVQSIGRQSQAVSGADGAIRTALAARLRLRGLALRSSVFDGEQLTVDLVSQGLDLGRFEAVVDDIRQEVNGTLERLGHAERRSMDVRILIDGAPPFAERTALASDSALSVSGRRVVINPGHGYYETTSGAWSLQRDSFSGIVEDFINLDLAVELNSLLGSSGAQLFSTRQLNKTSSGSHSASGKPWWQMGASEYVRSLGAPSTVWSVNTGINKDINARPLYANHVNGHFLVSIHNNGGGGCGTETLYDTGNGHQAASQELAEAVHGLLIDRLRSRWNSSWCNRGVKGFNGSYGENRMFNGPAIIVELAFMDTSADNSALQNQEFRTVAMTAIRDALVGGGGVGTPTASSVSPNTLVQGTGSQEVTVSGTNFTANSRHQLAVNGGQWVTPSTALTYVNATTVRVWLSTTTAQTTSIRVCADGTYAQCSGAVSVAIQAPTSNVALTVSKSGTGGGTVTSSPTGINCGATCSSSFASGTSVVLTAQPSSGSSFSGWSGCATSSGQTCTVQMSAARTVGATFSANQATCTSFSVSPFDLAPSSAAGSQVLSVTGSPTNCVGGSWTTSSTGDWLTASPASGSGASGSVVIQWTANPNNSPRSGTVSFGNGNNVTVTQGAASSTCTAWALSADSTVAGVNSSALTVTVFGFPSGCSGGMWTATSNASWLSLSQSSGGGASSTTNVHWQANTGPSRSGTVSIGGQTFTVNQNGATVATFPLQVTKTGTGTGTVTSAPAGISCGADCSEDFAAGASVVLTVSPATGAAFTGWSGACSGSETTCMVTMDAAKTATAAFSVGTGTLSVARSGDGSGTVTSSPAGISCGSDCSESYPLGTSVTLTANAGSGSTFSGWSGACTGATQTCSLNMDASTTVSATFVLQPTGGSEIVAVGLHGPDEFSFAGDALIFGDNSATDGFVKSVPKTGGTVTALASGLVVQDGGWRGVNRVVAAGDYIYGNLGTYDVHQIFKVPLAGGTVQILSNERRGPFIGVVDGFLYFGTNWTFLKRLPVDGGTSTELASTFFIRHALVEPGSVYFVDYYSKDVFHYDIATGMTQLALTREEEGRIFTNGSHLFWSTAGSVVRIAKSGGAVQDVLNASGVTGYAADNEYVYFRTSNAIGKVPVSGGSPTMLAEGVAPEFVAIDDTHVYYVDVGPERGARRIMRLPKGNAPAPVSLTVTRTGAGSGTVTSTPAGISCGSDCAEQFELGTAVTLTAAAASGSRFAGWSGACTGGAACVLAMDSAKAVTATFAPEPTTARAVTIGATTAAPGATVDVPVLIAAQGNESGFGFSLGWNPAHLTFVAVARGADVPNASLTPNSSASMSGRLGVVLTQPVDTSLASGSRELVRVTFIVASEVPDSIAVVFGSNPVLQEVADAGAGVLPAQFTDGAVTITRGLESDVAPRSTGNGVLSASDAVQLCRFVAGLDTPTSGSEFQRADTAPRDSRGNGALSAADCVQAQRDAAGLDAQRPAGGPTSATVTDHILPALRPWVQADVTRRMRMVGSSVAAGQLSLIPVRLSATGDENAVGFSVYFDPAVVTIESVTKGSGAGDATLLVNDLSAASGRIGVLLTLPTGAVWSAGARDLVILGVRVATGHTSPVALSFGDTPVFREVVDATATPLTTTFSGITITMAPAASLTVAPTALRFDATKTGTTLTTVTPSQTLDVRVAGVGVPTWSVTASQPWVRITPASGAGSGRFTVDMVNPGDVIGTATDLNGTITVSLDGLGLTQTLPVRLIVSPSEQPTQPPIGRVETPTHNSTGHVGAIGVTGWALDDRGVQSLKVYRNCLPFENQASCQSVMGHSVVFVGDAAFVPGARPDLETSHGGSFPQASRAGWGFLLLTSMLPDVDGQASHGGRGTLDLYVVATDLEHKQTLLGPDENTAGPIRLTMANQGIAKPFGALDTPGQGATVSGVVPIFGWALTPDRGDNAVIPIDGSTIWVYIDGAPVGQPVYNQCRGNVGNPPAAGVYCNDDVSNIFGVTIPGASLTTRASNPTVHRNLDAGRGAIGSYVLDTSTLSNGMHNIAWSVTDSLGRVEGIGSRNFTVLNAESDPVESAGVVGRPSSDVFSAVADRAALRATESSSALRLRVGFDLAAAFEEWRPDADGVLRVTIGALSRVEVALGAGMTMRQVDAEGAPRPLPVGSWVDGVTGRFTWAPGPAFRGVYRFVLEGQGGATRVEVSVK
jgi:N-acetylmuramoyl-L-alanine amidase